MIELDEFEISKKEYLKLIYRPVNETYYWDIPCSLLLFIAFAIVFDNWFIPALFCLPLCVLALLAALYNNRWFYYLVTKDTSIKETHFYPKPKISFDAEKIHVQHEDGSEDHHLLSHVRRVGRFGNYYCLFLNKGSCGPIPVPFFAFRSEEDQKQFEEVVCDKVPSFMPLWKKIVIFLLISMFLLGGAFGWRIMS